MSMLNQWRKRAKQVAKYQASAASALRFRPCHLEALERRLLLFSNGVLPFGVLGPPRHEEITTEALGFLRPDVLEAIIDANVHVDVESVTQGYGGGCSDPAHHFDGSSFLEGSAFVNEQYELFLTSYGSRSGLLQTELAGYFGTLLHPAQDFYAHSNWVDYIAAGTIAEGTLIDVGNGLWASLTPYLQIQPGVVLVEGEDLTPVTEYGQVQSLSRNTPGFEVTVVFADGTTMKGVISGDFDDPLFCEPNNTPDSVAVSHDDSEQDGVVIPGLNKDRPDRPLHYEASALATAQTRHEFKRLVALVRAQYGEEGVCQLLSQWVNPDRESHRQAIEALDLTAGEAQNLEQCLYVTRLYDDLLGRIPAAEEVGYWVGQLQNAGTRIEEAFISSREYASNLVQQFYTDFLQRDADEAGLNYWTDQIIAGMSPSALIAQFAASSEYLENAGNSNEGFIEKLYSDMFGRTAGDVESGYWLARLEEGASRDAIAQVFSASDEFFNLLLNDPAEVQDFGGWYSDYLDREADEQGSAFWRQQLSADGNWRSVQLALLSSNEYFELIEG